MRRCRAVQFSRRSRVANRCAASVFLGGLLLEPDRAAHLSAKVADPAAVTAFRDLALRNRVGPAQCPDRHTQNHRCRTIIDDRVIRQPIELRYDFAVIHLVLSCACSRNGLHRAAGADHWRKNGCYFFSEIRRARRRALLSFAPPPGARLATICVAAWSDKPPFVNFVISAISGSSALANDPAPVGRPRLRGIRAASRCWFS